MVPLHGWQSVLGVGWRLQFLPREPLHRLRVLTTRASDPRKQGRNTVSCDPALGLFHNILLSDRLAPFRVGGATQGRKTGRGGPLGASVAPTAFPQGLCSSLHPQLASVLSWSHLLISFSRNTLIRGLLLSRECPPHPTPPAQGSVSGEFSLTCLAPSMPVLLHLLMSPLAFC